MATKGISLALLLALTAAPAALADSWKIDPYHSAAEFSVRHMMVSNVRGNFSKVSGSVQYDPKKLADTKVDAVIDVNTIDTREPKRDEHLRGADFFDVTKYPTMKFESKKALVNGNGKFKLVGNFTLHGVTKEVTLDVDGPSAPIKDKDGNEHIGATATGKINRTDFGMKYNSPIDGGGFVLGEEIPLTIDVELIKPNSAATTKKAG